MTTDERTQAERDTAKQLLADYRKRIQAEQDAKGKNPLQQPPVWSLHGKEQTGG